MARRVVSGVLPTLHNKSRVPPTLHGAQVVEVDEGETRRYCRIVPAVQLGAYIVAADAPGVPAKTWPFPPHERAMEARHRGDLAEVIGADVELLTWMAGTLTCTPVDEDDPAAPAWAADIELHEQLAIEAERLRHAAARLIKLRGRVVACQADEDEE